MLRKLIQVVFILACWGSLVWISAQTLRVPTTYTSENRQLATKPGLPRNRGEASTYPKQMEDWWNDSIHYRQYFIRISTLMRMSVGVNPHGEVLIGKNGWMFWTGERTLDAFRNSAPLTADEVERWRQYLLFRHHDALQHGARYYFVIPPNKETMYPEFMPDNITILGKQSWIDQIVQSVQQDDVQVIDLRKILVEAKNQQQRIYNQTDTHWNIIGANYAQYEIIRALSRDYPLLKPYLYPVEAFYYANVEAFNNTDIFYYNGLAHMLGITDITRETEPLFKIPLEKCAQPAEVPLTVWWQDMPEPQRSQTFHAATCDKGHYRVMMMRDSFTQQLEPLLTQQFAYIAYLWLPRPNDMGTWSFFLENIHPDIVIDQTLERYLAIVPRARVDYPAN